MDCSNIGYVSFIIQLCQLSYETFHNNLAFIILNGCKLSGF